MKKRLTYSIPISAMAVLLFVSVAVAQSTPDQGIPNPNGTGQGSSQAPSTPNTVTSTTNNSLKSVSINATGFNPARLFIAPGSMVKWINVDTKPHTVTLDDGSFDSQEVKPGDSYTIAFGNELGTWKYHSTLDNNMTGSVTVRGPSGRAPVTPQGSSANPTQASDNTATQQANDNPQPTDTSTQPAVDSAPPSGDATQVGGT